MSRSTLALAVAGTMFLVLSLATAARAVDLLGLLGPAGLIQLKGSGTGTLCPVVADTKLVDELVRPDGSTQSGFTIPKGYVLIVTEVEFFAGATAGDIVAFTLDRETSSQDNTIVSTRVTLDAGGETITRVIIPSGAAVNSGTLICFYAYDTTKGTALIDSRASVYGYLAIK